MNPAKDDDRMARLRWRCRRGMLELDLILARFLDTEYAQLTPRERESFDALLQLGDATLLALLEGRQPSERFAPLIERLRRC